MTFQIVDENEHVIWSNTLIFLDIFKILGKKTLIWVMFNVEKKRIKYEKSSLRFFFTVKKMNKKIKI